MSIFGTSCFWLAGEIYTDINKHWVSQWVHVFDEPAVPFFRVSYPKPPAAPPSTECWDITLWTDLPWAEQLATVATMVASFWERELYITSLTAVTSIVLDPVICHDTTWLICHCPAVYTTFGITYIYCLVVPKQNKITTNISKSITLYPTQLQYKVLLKRLCNIYQE